MVDKEGLPPLEIVTASFCCKWGFEELLSDFGEDCELYFEVDKGELLYQLCNRYVVPSIDQKVEVVRNSSGHNQVRFKTVDGVEVDWSNDRQDGLITPEQISVPAEDVIALCNELGGSVKPLF